MKKIIYVDDVQFELKITDYTCGIPGWFSVKAWENKRKFFAEPCVYFNTFDNPLKVAKQQIEHYLEKKRKYLQIIEELEED